MEVILSYRGRGVSEADAAFIRNLIKEHPQASRYQLSKLLCQTWNWVQANGSLRDMVCRGLMLELHRKGHIELPPVRQVIVNPLANRVKPPRIEFTPQPMNCTLAQLQPLEFRQIRRTTWERLFNSLLEEHHYLNYTQPVGEHLKYLVFAKEQPIACLSWSSAPRHLKPRDNFIGWSAEARKKNIHLVTYNSRFLILPWVKVPHLASHILGRMARILPMDWEKLYRHPVYYLETFIDPNLFHGTCYRAANWIYLGLTKGLGKDSQTKKVNRSLKEVLGYPLTQDFRKRLSSVK